MKGEKSQSLRPAFALAALGLCLAGPALAASTPDDSPGVDSVPERTAPGTPPSQNLSQKLDQSNGVIHPTNVDPGMQKPAPSTGTGGVIKPPGTPGGPPGATPK